MSKITRFDDRAAWQKARLLAGSVYEVTCVGAFAKEYGFTRQIQRAAVSIMSNIAEGYERRSRAEFYQFLTIAKASCAEIRSQLYLAHDLGYLDTLAFEQILKDAEEVSRIIGGLRGKVGSQRKHNPPPSGAG